jgi:alkanesulfonate monooxygenase SsuD/methylene tetrahydromethanopterin reductase-like flavin-dependent oxidoreductase (luciferase family)
MSGFFQTHPSPQHTPVIFQAGASKSGIEFAGKHAEAIYTYYATFDTLKAYTASVRTTAIAAGRDPSTIKIFAATMPIIGRTVEEANAKYEAAKKHISVQSGMAKFSSYANTDLGQIPIDEEFKFEAKAADNAITGVINGFRTAAEETTEKWTPRYLGQFAGFGGTTPKPVGTPEIVADVFEEWFNTCGIDGFNIACEFSETILEVQTLNLILRCIKSG